MCAHREAGGQVGDMGDGGPAGVRAQLLSAGRSPWGLGRAMVGQTGDLLP